MNNNELQILSLEVFKTCEKSNTINASTALRAHLAGMQIFDEPLIGVARASDPLFETFKDPKINGPHVLMPHDWIPNAKSVVSFFLPFTARVKKSNALDPQTPSSEWLHARIEGQAMVVAFGEKLSAEFEQKGYAVAFPTCDKRFAMVSAFRSNWSERHVAYAAGLGTFGLSKGLITARGIAGRFGSIITSAEIEPTPRSYNSPFEYCTMCGKCAINCPVGAIDTARGVANGKDHSICQPLVGKQYVDRFGTVRYGCGKCQVAVPCQDGIPTKKESLQS